MALPLLEGRENGVAKTGTSPRDVREMLEAEDQASELPECATRCVGIQLPRLCLHGALGLQEGGGRRLQGGTPSRGGRREGPHLAKGTSTVPGLIYRANSCSQVP